MGSFKVAAVQAAPVFLDRDATVEKTVGLIAQAAEAGAGLIGFPEGFVPGHPGWVELLPLDGRTLALSERLFKNAVEVPGDAIDTIARACGQHGVAAVVGICERRPHTTGTLWNAQVYIDADGAIADEHQKFVPTIGERPVHGPGTTGSENSMRVGDLNVTGLICGENSTLAQYASARAYPTVHVASWPQHFSPDLAMQPVIEIVGPALAYTLKPSSSTASPRSATRCARPTASRAPRASSTTRARAGARASSAPAGRRWRGPTTTTTARGRRIHRRGDRAQVRARHRRALQPAGAVRPPVRGVAWIPLMPRR